MGWSMQTGFIGSAVICRSGEGLTRKIVDRKPCPLGVVLLHASLAYSESPAAWELPLLESELKLLVGMADRASVSSTVRSNWLDGWSWNSASESIAIVGSFADSVGEMLLLGELEKKGQSVRSNWKFLSDPAMGARRHSDHKEGVDVFWCHYTRKWRLHQRNM